MVKKRAGAVARDAWRGRAEGRALLLVVFVCGAVLMAFEIVGSRILAPTFGSTVFVWGSLIGVFLGALSLGYALGGRLADRVPRLFVLGAIIAAAGLIVIFVPLYAPACCQWIDRSGPGHRWNPLAASVGLFFLPSVLMGMVSPFAVRLQARTVATVGNVAGRLYSLSTLGSIAGTLLGTFWLVPSFGTSNIARGLGLTLVVVAIVAMLPGIRARLAEGEARAAVLSALLFVLAIAFLLVPAPSFIRLDQDERLILETDSPYQHIGVVVQPWLYGRGAQWSLQLRFDKYIESEILLDDPDKLRIRQPYESGAKYTDTLHLPFVFNPGAQDVVIVGGGGGVAPTIFARDYPQLQRIDVVEIDPQVLEVSKRYFGFKPDGKRLRATVADGRVYLRDTDRTYDVIILDAFTGGRPPFHLLTRECLGTVRRRLSDRGVLQVNIISALEGPRSPLFWALLKTMVEVFGRESVYVFPKWYDQRWGSGEVRRSGINIELLALNFATSPSPRPKSSLIEDAERLVLEERRIKIESVLQHVQNSIPIGEFVPAPGEPARREWRQAPILTDDYAPVDNMVID